MKLTKSQLRVIDGIRRAQRWRLVNAWGLAAASAIFFAFALIAATLLMAHLHEHGVRLLNLFVVLWESQHPSHIQVLSVFTLGIAIVMLGMVAFQCAFGAVVVLLRGREQKLLLELWGEDATERSEKGVRNHFQ